jgi:hypothetical protein
MRYLFATNQLNSGLWFLEEVFQEEATLVLNLPTKGRKG